MASPIEKQHGPSYAELAPASASSGLRVIGAGLPRTGTKSCCHALQKLLGGRCYHMVEAIGNGHLPIWANQTPGQPLKPEALDLLRPYSACIDLPVMVHWRELLALNPGAKVLLTVRDSFDAWYASAYDTVYQVNVLHAAMPWYAAWLDPQIKINCRLLASFWGRQGMFKGRFEDKEFARKVYEQHTQEVLRSVPKDQVLLFNVKEGWGPLCAFLGVPVPDEPFPRVNEAQLFKERFLPPHRRKLRWMRFGVPLAGAAMAAAIAGALQLLRLGLRLQQRHTASKH